MIYAASRRRNMSDRGVFHRYIYVAAYGISRTYAKNTADISAVDFYVHVSVNVRIHRARSNYHVDFAVVNRQVYRTDLTNTLRRRFSVNNFLVSAVTAVNIMQRRSLAVDYGFDRAVDDRIAAGYARDKASAVRRVGQGVFDISGYGKLAAVGDNRAGALHGAGQVLRNVFNLGVRVALHVDFVEVRDFKSRFAFVRRLGSADVEGFCAFDRSAVKTTAVQSAVDHRRS